MESMEQVEVKLLEYTFKFKRMLWREDFAIKFPPNKDPQRVMLAAALLEVSNLKPKDFDDALRVMDAIPAAIVNRVFRIWRGSFPSSRRFTVSKLYRAPAPVTYVRKMEEIEDREDVVHDRLVEEMESKFGPKELADARDIERKIMTAAQRKEGGYKGAVPATKGDHGGN
jgi:hypothetical protein